MPSDRQLRELRSLTPWNWDTKSAKHPPGQAALRDFERIEQAYLSQPGAGRTRQHDDAFVSKFSAPDPGADKKAPSSTAKEPASEAWEALTPGAFGTNRTGQKAKRQRKSSACASQDTASAGKASSSSSLAHSQQHLTSTPATVPYNPDGKAQERAHVDTPTIHSHLKQLSCVQLPAPTPLPLGLGDTPILRFQQPGADAEALAHKGSTDADQAGAESEEDGRMEEASKAGKQGSGASAQPQASQQQQQQQQQVRELAPIAPQPSSGAAMSSVRMPPPRGSGSSRRPLHKRQHRRAPSAAVREQQLAVRAAGKRRAESADVSAGETRGTLPGDALIELAAAGLQHGGSGSGGGGGFEPAQQQGSSRVEQTPELDASLTLLSMAPAARGSPFSFAHHAAAVPITAPCGDASPAAAATPVTQAAPCSASPPALTPLHQKRQPPPQQGGSMHGPQGQGVMRPQQAALLPSQSLGATEALAMDAAASAASPAPLGGAGCSPDRLLHPRGKLQHQAPRPRQTSLPFPGLRTITSSTLRPQAAAPEKLLRVAAAKENVPPAPPASSPPGAASAPPALPGAAARRQAQGAPQAQRHACSQALVTLAWQVEAAVTGPAHPPAAAAGNGQHGPVCGELPTPGRLPSQLGGGAEGGVRVGWPCAGHGFDAGCSHSSSGLLGAASMASLHHIVRAVAAYCHSLNIKPSGGNVQQAQAIIALLHAGQPAQACELLQQLRPEARHEERRPAEVEGMAPASLPIAPLVLPTFPPLDHDWCDALNPSTTLTLHALVSSHRALRDAVSVAAYSQSCPMPPHAAYAAPSSIAAGPTGMAAGVLSELHVGSTSMAGGVLSELHVDSPGPTAALPASTPARAYLTDQSNNPTMALQGASAKSDGVGANLASASVGGCIGVYMSAR